MSGFFLLYDLIVSLAVAVALPYLLVRRAFGGRRGILAGLGERFGSIPATQPPEAEAIWIHCVSVGEVMAARPLARALTAAHPRHPIRITTVTESGRAVAKRELGDCASIQYAPIDHRWAVRRALCKIRPALAVFFETEIWPNLIRTAHMQNAAIAIVNGRISDRSFPGYKRVRRVLAPILAMLDLVLMQSAVDAERAIAIGAPPERVRSLHNLKWFVSPPDDRHPRDWRETLGIPRDHKVVVAGSTGPGEEEIVLDAIDSIRAQVERLSLIIAPRKPDRFRDVEQLLARRGVAYAVRSRRERGALIVLLDTIGELQSVYSVADVVFVGGSLVDVGGHNPLEPAAHGKAIVFGPHVSNFREICGTLVDAGGAVTVKDGKELAGTLLGLLNDPRRAATIGENARALLASYSTALDETVRALSELIERTRMKG